MRLTDTFNLKWKWLLLITAFVFTKHQTCAQPAYEDWPRIGMNQEWQELQNWTNTIAFNNLFKIADDFSGGDDITFDSDGYPLTGFPAISNVYVGENLTLGTYTIRWDGEGDFTLHVGSDTYEYSGACPAEGHTLEITNPMSYVHMQINSTNSDDHLRNMRMYLPGYDDDSPHQFTDCYLGLFASPIDVVRPMWWTMVPSSSVQHWEDRPTTTQFTYGGDDDATNWGTAYEHMIDLANLTSSDLWICVPVMADDNYVTELANLIHSRLDASSNVIVEYSNESSWNYWYEYHENQTVEEVGLAGYPGDGEEGSVWAQHKYAARSAQVLQLFDEAFGEDQNRLIGVLGCQSGYFGPTENMVDAINWMGHMDLFDAFAIAPYIGDSHLITENWPDMDAIFDAIDEYIFNVMDGTESTGPPDDKDDPITLFYNLAEQYNKKVVTYESGQHFVATSIGGVGGGLTGEQLAAVNNDPRMYQVYARYMEAWDRQSITSTNVLYTSTSACHAEMESCFGMVTSCSQPLEEAHKLRGVLDWANSANDQTAPEVISNLSGTSIASNSLTLQWSAATDDVGVLEYLIFQDGSVVDSTSSLHLDISGLAASTTYEFYVVTKDVAGNLSGNSNSASLTTLAQGEEDTTAPSAPSNLVVVATTATTVSLQWDASTDNVGVNDYLILQDGVPEDSTGNTAITISDLSANSEYVFQIIARDVSGNSSSGSEITATTSEEEDFTPPSAPANLMLLETTSSTVSFQWDASTDDVGVNDYLIYQDGVLIDSTSDTEMTIEGLMSNTSYNFYVEARDESGNRSESSEVLSITTEQEFVEDITAPSTPGNLRISNSSTSSITLEWDESFDDIGVNRYVVFQDNDPSDSTGQTTITIEDLPAGRNLSFHVVAKDAAGNTSSSSNTVLLSTITLGATFTNDDLVVYPNPVINGNLHLALRDKAMSELKVIDMAGKIVDHRMLSNQQAHDVTIRLNVKPGLYTVIVRTDAGRRVSKRIRIVN